MSRSNQYLYTVYRRKDDLLIAFEERPAKAAELMGIKISTFYTIVSRLFGVPGYKCRYDIIRTTKGEGYEREHGLTGKPVYTIHRASDNALICHEQPVEVAARAIGVKVKSLRVMTARQKNNPDGRYRYLITRVIR